jgi:predicted porin
MKNKILAMLVAFGLVGSVSAVEVNENLSINGFIDGSISQSDNDTTGKDATFGLDEVEVNFLFNVGSVSGESHVDSASSGNDLSSDGGLNIEQAHFTYSLENGISVTFGRYGSALGLEREDPAGLSTVSRAYGSDIDGTISRFNLGNIDAGAVEGVTISYAAEAWSIGVSIENAAGNDLGVVGTAANDVNYEIALSYTGVENLSVGGGFFIENDVDPTIAGAVETDAWNINATYSVGKALLGAEYTELSPSGATDRDAFLLLVDYDVSDKLGVAVRYSSYDDATGTSASNDVDTITVAPNYAITDSLGAIIEYSSSDNDTAGQDEDLIAIELTYTF